MAELRNVIYDIERCVCHVPDACRDCSHYKHGEYLDCMEDLLSEALELLKEQQHWIPAEERLPKSMINKVIVYVQHEDLASRIGFGHFEKYHGVGTWWDLERDEPFIKHGFTVTHWMPIPKSPYGEELILS